MPPAVEDSDYFDLADGWIIPDGGAAPGEGFREDMPTMKSRMWAPIFEWQNENDERKP